MVLRNFPNFFSFFFQSFLSLIVCKTMFLLITCASPGAVVSYFPLVVSPVLFPGKWSKVKKRWSKYQPEYLSYQFKSSPPAYKKIIFENCIELARKQLYQSFSFTKFAKTGDRLGYRCFHRKF